METNIARYYIVEGEGKLLLVSSASSNVVLSYEPGKTLRPRGARKRAAGTIFLDGSLSAPPFSDNARRHYNFDHHSSCERAATRSSCMQALIAVIQGLPLNEGEWELVVNGLDADSALAAWTLLNHAEFERRDGALTAAVAPIYAAEDLIDSLGMGLVKLAGRDPEEFAAISDTLETIHAAAKIAEGDPKIGLPALMKAIDKALLPEAECLALADYREMARLRLERGKIALFCRSGLGILELEAFITERFKNRVGLLLLQSGDNRWTVKMLDRFFGKDLTALYRKLNQRDGASRRSSEEEEAWGGSGTIGGSPRKEGSALALADIVDCVRAVYGERVPFLTRLVEYLR